MDMVLSVNGVPFATMEIKNPFTGQSWKNAVYQYRTDRDPRAPLFLFKKGAVVIDPRGELLNASNIQERLTMRNFLDGLRSSGVETGGPPALSSADRQSFANQLDRLLAKR